MEAIQEKEMMRSLQPVSGKGTREMRRRGVRKGDTFICACTGPL